MHRQSSSRQQGRGGERTLSVMARTLHDREKNGGKVQIRGGREGQQGSSRQQAARQRGEKSKEGGAGRGSRAEGERGGGRYDSE